MLKNYFKIAWRQIKKQKFHAFINTIGLALSVACCLLIGLFVSDELSYDKTHPGSENIYRVSLDINMNDWEGKGTAIPAPMMPTLKEEMPEVVNAGRLNPYFENAGSNLVKTENEVNTQFEDGFVYADQAFMDIFQLPLISGNAKQILTQPMTMVITQRIAEKYFATEDPVGKSLILNDDPEQAYKITGVLENLPENIHFNYDFFLSMESLADSRNDIWVYNNYFGYVQMAPGTNPNIMAPKLAAFGKKHLAPQFKERLQVDMELMRSKGLRYDIFLQPIQDIHLHSEGFYPQLKPNGDIRYVWFFTVIAIFILLIAVVNFINLSTARSANRAKEVGVRKVMGAFHKQLVFQFLAESILISALAFLFGILIAEFSLPFFNQLTDKTLNFPVAELWFLPSLLVIAVMLGIFAGLYPAFYLSNFHPAAVLKGKLSKGSKSSWLRSGLVVFQFSISIMLIIGTLVVTRQMQYIQNKKIGFEKDQVLLIHDTYTINQQLPSFKNEVVQLPEVKNASLTSYLPLADGSRNSITFYPAGKSSPENQELLQFWPVDHDYINTLGIEVVEGRNFSKEQGTDEKTVILNEKAVRSLDLEDPVGKQIQSPFIDDPYTVVGVMKNFNFESLKTEIQPLAIFLGNSNNILSIKSASNDIEPLIAKLETTWKKFAPNQPFRYTFLDDRFAQMYRMEHRVGNIFQIFAALAIFIACLGLFALATFMAEQRTKEISIRKILGASFSNLFFLLSRNFLALIFISLLIASPVAWWIMNRWLEGFSYRIELHWSFFLIAAIMAIFIAMITISSQAIRAVLTNPAEVLKNE